MKSEKRLGRLGAVLLMLAGPSVAACGGPSTVFASSWRAPKAEPLNMRGEPVVAVVMMENETTRRNAEDVMAREISHYGAKGIPMYTLMEKSPVDNEAVAKAAIEAAGVKGIVVLRPMGIKTESETHTSYYTPMYNAYWGGYYGYGWGAAYIHDTGSPNGAVPTAAPIYYGGMPSTQHTYTTTTKLLQVEVMIYSLKQNILVWAGVSESTEPGKKVDEFVIRLAAATIKEIGGQGLISN
jgi:hypothetical protein